jgi:PKD repeat protein
MRTSFVTVTGALALTLLAGCTVKDVDPPSLAGPSTMAKAIVMKANKDTLYQDGVDFVDILVTSTGPDGQQQAIPLRADIFVGGVAQDFGSLNTKAPVTPTTLRYTAPNASPLAGGQVAQTITIAVTPVDSGDFRSEVARQLDLRLVPQGVIQPSNPNLTAAFVVTPASPQAYSTASFNAATSTNSGVACGTACGYSWLFGDGTSGTGMTTTHEYRTVGAYQVTLTVTDSRGAQATSVQTVNVSASTPPTALFLVSPTPVGINQDVFFNAEQSRATLPRTIVSYGWNFGDGRTASGMTVSRSFSANGVYNVVLTVTDDAGAFGQATQALTVGAAGAGPTAGAITVSPTPVTTATTAFFNASAFTAGTAPIVSYRFNYGDGTPDDVGSPSTQSHRFLAAGIYTVRVTATDSQGRTATGTLVVTVT